MWDLLVSLSRRSRDLLLYSSELMGATAAPVV